jgi:DNA-binding transcriptional MerR regulator
VDGVVHIGEAHIGEAARLLSVSPKHLRTLERDGRIPPARRDFNGRVYSEFDIAVLKSMGVGRRPRRLRRVEEVLRAR